VTLPSGRRREGLPSSRMLGIASGAILVPLNSTMLAVALPGIMGEFRLGANEVSSLVSLYLGAVAVVLPLAGSLVDRFGARRIFLGGVLMFAAASLIGAVGTSFVILEVARALQAAFGALISTSSAALIREMAHRDRQGEAFGLFDLLVSSSAAIGPFVGGVVVATFGWRSLFTIAIPVALLAAAMVGALHRPPRTTVRPDGPRPPLDLAGLGLLALLIVAFLVALRTFGTVTGTIALAATLPLFALFVLAEARAARPAVDLALLRQAPFASAAIGVFGATVVLHGCFFLVPILVEGLLAGSPTASGLVLLGIAGVSAIFAPWGGRLSDRLGRRPVAVAGSLVTAVGLAVLAGPIGMSTAIAVGVLLGVVGLGLGLAGAPRQAGAFESVEPERVGMAAGTYYTARYLGGVVGASLGGAVLAAGVTTGGMSVGFGLLAIVSGVVAIVSFGLPSAPRGRRV
jgi:MFS family permease